MLEVTIPDQDFFIEANNTFVNIKGTKLQLEHSLLALQKWESRWHKPFLKNNELTHKELSDYIYCMTLNKNINEELYEYLPAPIINQVVEYIKDPMTATTFTELPLPNKTSRNGKFITAEIIYYWMTVLNIPFECRKWHLNQLLTLIKVVNYENSPPKKMNKADAAKQRAAINAARRAKYNTKG